MFNEPIKIMKKKEIELKNIEKNFQDIFVVYFTIDCNDMPFKNIKHLKNDLFSKFLTQQPDCSVMAFEFRNHDSGNSFDSKINLHYFFEKIQRKIEDPKLNFKNINNRNYFCMIIEQKFKETFLHENDYTKYNDVDFFGERENIFKPKDDFKNYLCFFSNFKATKTEYEFLLKIYNPKLLECKEENHSIFCLTLKVDGFKNLCIEKFNENIIKNKDPKSIFPYIISFLHHSNASENIFDLESNNILKTSFITHNSTKVLHKKCLLKRKESIDYKLDFKMKIYRPYNNEYVKENFYQLSKQEKCKFELYSLSYNLVLYKSINITTKQKDYIQFLYPNAQSCKLYKCILQSVFGKNILNLYKINENVKATEKKNLLKLTIVALFKLGRNVRRISFFYYKKKKSKKISNYQLKEVKKSQIEFLRFIQNIITLLQNGSQHHYNNLNLFYCLFFVNEIEFSYANCIYVSKKFFFNNSYINLIKTIYDFYTRERCTVNIFQLFCDNYNKLKHSYYSIFEYNDAKNTKIEEIEFENFEVIKNTYYILQVTSEKCTLKLCIVPEIDEEFYIKIFLKKDEIINLFKEILIKNIEKKIYFLESMNKNLIETESYIELETENETIFNEEIIDYTDSCESMLRVFKNLSYQEFNMLLQENFPLKFDLKSKFYEDLFLENLTYKIDFVMSILNNKKKEFTPHFENFLFRYNKKKTSKPLLFKKAILIECEFLVIFKELKDKILERYINLCNNFFVIGYTNDINYDKSEANSIFSKISNVAGIPNLSINILQQNEKKIYSI
ncbi:hypothetical protein GVAV_002765 [Gurleya vavrai]